MINSIEIKNFRCFERLEIKKCKRINVLVGENGSGKTSLLEAIFFALGSSPGMGLRFRQARGLEGTFSGSSRVVEEAIWGDYFYAND
jgi:recombinational DNA repair ATPase RecF